MDRGQRAFQSQRFAQFGQGHVGLVLEVLAHGDAMLGDDALFASGEVMPGLDAASLLALLEQLLDHAV